MTTENNAAKWGLCRLCGSPIEIPGLDANLCSTRRCGSSGWVTDLEWQRARQAIDFQREQERKTRSQKRAG